jgi:hypothetical protein
MLRSKDFTAGRGPRAVAATIVLVPVVVALAVIAFAWPSARLAPRDLPIGVACPPQAATAIQRQLAQRDNAFDVHLYTDESAARAAITDRDIYGALVASPTNGLTILTASAASPTVAQLLSQAATEAGRGSSAAQPSSPGSGGSAPGSAAGQPSSPGSGGSAQGLGQPRVVDVVPADPDDPRGAALSASLLPLVLAGVAAGVLIGSARRPGLGQAVALVAATALAGLAAVGIAQGWLGVIGGDWLTNAGVVGLTVLAIAAAVAGLRALLGNAGLGLAGLLMVLLGNPLSGVSSAPELLPQPFGLIGQLLPPGAGGTLLRSTAFFDGSAATMPLTVLTAWAVLGLAAVCAGGLLRRRPATAATVRPIARGAHEGSSAAS